MSLAAGVTAAIACVNWVSPLSAASNDHRVSASRSRATWETQLLVVQTDSGKIAIEVELTAKAPYRLQHLIRAWTLDDQIAALQARAEQLNAKLDELEAGDPAVRAHADQRRAEQAARQEEER